MRATRSYLKRHPSEPNGWDELGLRYLASGFPDSAEAAYQKAVELDPNWLPESFSFCAYHRGDLMGAINGFENMLTRRNLNADRRKYLTLDNQFALHLAALYIEAGRFEKAHSACRTYIAPADRDLGHLLLEMGETKAALDLADQLDKELGIGANIAELRGKALVAIGDLQGARAVAKTLLESEFEWGGRARYEALQIQAEVALAERNAEEALDLLNRMKTERHSIRRPPRYSLPNYPRPRLPDGRSSGRCRQRAQGNAPGLRRSRPLALRARDNL